MALNEMQRFKLKKFIEEMETYRGRHTELVTVYIPAGYDLNKIINHLAQEQGTASNIKSAATRNNVIDALEKMIQHLRLYNKTPEHGLAVFSGNIAEEGRYDFKVASVEPPVPLKTRIYRCDKTFQLDLLKEMFEVNVMYGLVVMDRREANIALLKGKTIVPLQHFKSNVPGKTRAGGQSSARFMRIREDSAKEFYRKIGFAVKDEFLKLEGLKGVIIGGPGPTKYEFVDGDFITTEVKRKIIAVKDVTYTGDFGLQELLERSQDTLANEDIMAEKKIMGRFFDYLAKKPGMVTYGLNETKRMLEVAAVELVLLSSELDNTTVQEFEEEAKKSNAEITIISTETREGVQLRDLGKVAAILRYEMS